MGAIDGSGSRIGRRVFLSRALAAGAGAFFGRAQAARSYPQTIAALAYALQRETDAHLRYVEFARVARGEGYRGIAYLFSAFATSEGIHARNFRELLAQLGGPTEVAATSIRPGTTRQNLIAAVEDEIDSIDRLYPGTLERMRPEGHLGAATLVGYAWQSERQHRDLIQKIRRYSPLLFEQVARTIDAKTSRYFVCDGCGSTQNKLPGPACGVCAGPPEQVRLVPPPG